MNPQHKRVNTFDAILIMFVVFGLGNLAVDVYDTYTYRNVVVQDGQTAQQLDEHLRNH